MKKFKITSLILLFLSFLYLSLTNIYVVKKDTYTLSASSSNINNIAIFVKFKGSNNLNGSHIDDEESVLNANTLYNSDELISMNGVNGLVKVPSFKKYMQMQSYGKLSITTKIFPMKDNKVIAYEDPNPIDYYLSYNENNPVGYTNQDEQKKRELTLINNALSYCMEQIENTYTKEDLDYDNDNIVDAISFVVEGRKNLSSNIAWGDLLWSHKSDNNNITKTILGKKIKSYNILLANDYKEQASLFSLNQGTYATIIHEFGHMLGYMDLYRYASNDRPVGFFDIMGNTIGSNPQNFLTYFISEYSSKTNWHDPLPTITKTTKNITLSKPEFKDSSEKRAIKIDIGMKDEYFIVEYYEEKDTYENYKADTGIIIYRVNEKNKGYGNTRTNDVGKNDHIYIFRPGETSPGEGKGLLTKATLNMQRKTLGKDLNAKEEFDNETIYTSDGKNTGLIIKVTSIENDKITFDCMFPSFEGDGTQDSPYLIKDSNTFFNLMSIDTTGKYYKLVNDLDFSSISTYPSINFKGNLDGNNKTISNIKTNGAGLFNEVGNYDNHTFIKNLKLKNINIYSNKGNNLGGLANSCDNVTIKNVHLIDGKIIDEGVSINSLASTGGFVGYVTNTTIIEDSSSTLNVESKKNTGGFIGINLNASIKNCYFLGNVTSSNNKGFFIGIQVIADNYYNVPTDAYYINHNNNIKAVGGYDEVFHNLEVLDKNSLSKGIVGINIKENITIDKNKQIDLPITTTPNKALKYDIDIEDKNILKYENKKLEGLNKGESRIYINFTVGSNIISIPINVKVEESNNLTEEEVLRILGLTKKNKYVVGFKVGTNIKNIKKTLTNNNIVLKTFTNNQNKEITDGIVATGMRFTININNTDYNYIIVIKGDVNGDGYIYATDYVKIKNYIMGKTTLKNEYYYAADVNGDGYIYATDYVKIKNYIMGKGTILQK